MISRENGNDEFKEKREAKMLLEQEKASIRAELVQIQTRNIVLA